MTTRSKKIKDAPSTYEAKGYNQASIPKETNSHPWRKKNNNILRQKKRDLLKKINSI